MKGRLFSHLMVTALVGLTALSSSAGASDWLSHDKWCSNQSCLARHSSADSASELILVRDFRPPLAAHIGPWHLVRTPAPENKETVSIMRTGELLKSDPDFAGLMIKCQQAGSFQIGFIVIRPFPPKSRPQITISSGQNTLHFQGSVASPGTIVSLPQEAGALAQGPWQSAHRLTVQIKGDGAEIHGTVSLDRLSEALTLLQANCPTQ